MNKTEQVYIQLISNSINQKDKPISFENVSLEQMIDLCKLHRNTGLVYASMKNQKNVPAKMLKVFEQGFYVEMMTYSKRMTNFNIVLEELNKRSIPHIIVKGLTYAECYPQKELRTMGDMDLIIEVKYQNCVKKIFESLDGEYQFDQSSKKGLNYKLNNTVFEIHNTIGYAGSFNKGYDYEEYFKNAIKEKKLIKENTYEFSPYYKLIYSIFHIAKHFYESGCGVRMITDMTILIKKYYDIIDKEKFATDLKKMGLYDFALRLFSLCNKWFDLGKTEYLKDFHDINIIESYIISGGIFGYNSISADVVKIRKQKNSSYFVSLLKWAFPTYSEMKEHSLWFKDKSPLLLPVAYVERYVRNVKKRGGAVKWIKGIFRGKNENSNQRKILNIMRLK